MRTRLKLDFWLTLLVVIFPLCSFGVSDELPDPEGVNTTLVEIEYAPEYLVPYRERRSDWGIVSGVFYENFYPTAYKSPIGPQNYSDLFGENQMAMMGLQGGLKYNLSFASVSGEVSYSTGSIRDNRVGDDVTLRVSRLGAHAAIWLDMLFPEPYVVPYAQADFTQADWEEKDSQSSQSGSMPLFGYRMGALIQLNWLDPEAALAAQVSSGLNNAYIDLFVSQATGSENLDSEMSWGAGVKLEF